MTLPQRIVIAVLAAGLLFADAAWMRVGPVVPAVVAFWLLLAGLACAVVPRYAWTHAIVAACVLAGWPAAFEIGDIAAGGCGSGNVAVDVLASVFLLGPFLALLVPLWTPIPIAAVGVADLAGLGLQRVFPRPLRWWIVAAALVSIVVVAEVSRRYLIAGGVHPTGAPCWNL